MRIARLDLTHYGKFSDTALTFAKVAGADLHFVVGPNEAGKSTVRNAILNFLYGIDRSSPYGYRGLKDMELGALIEVDGDKAALRRLKARSFKDSLADPAGAKLDPSVLTRLMGNADEAFYRRMFGLDHRTLVESAKEMLKSAGDVGQMLFQVDAGVNGLHELRERLEKEAGELWTKKQNMGCAFYVAQKKFTEAQASVRQATISGTIWQKQRRAFDTAEDALRHAQRAFAEAARELQRLERIRRVLPFLREHDDASAELSTLGEPPLLPATAAATLEAARSALAEAQGRIDLMTGRLDEEIEATKAITVNEPVLERKVEIDSLAGRLQTYLDAVRDHPGMEMQRNRSAEKARQLAARLGWTETEVMAIASRMPAKVERSTLAALALQRPALAQAAVKAREKVDAQDTQIDSVSRRIEAAPAHAPHPGLAAAMRAATALNLAVRGPAAKTKLATATIRRERAFAALAPWQGDESQLRAVKLPDAAERQRFSDRRTELTTQRSRTQQTRDAKAIDAAKAKATLDAFERQHHLVTGEAVSTARHEREEVWRKVRAAGTVFDFVNQYEARVAAADGMADQRYDGAAKIEQQVTLQTAHDALQAEVEALDRQLSAADRQLAELDAQWRQRMAGLGLVLTPLQLAEWSRLRDEALAAAEARTEADGEGRALADETTDVANALRAALAEAGVTPAEGAGVPVLAAHAETTNAERAATATRVSEWEGELRTARGTLPALQRVRDDADHELAAWDERWVAKLQAAGLPADLPPEAIATANETLAEIDAACEDAHGNAGPRASQMQREIATFAERTRALADACVPHAEAEPSEKILLLLRDLLRDAESQSKKRALAEAAIARTRAALEEAEADKVKATAVLAPLYGLAKVADVPALAAAVAAAERYREVAGRVSKAAGDARLSGDHLPLADLAAERASVDVERVDDLLLAAQRGRDESKDKLEAAIRTHTQAKADFEKIAGQDGAARAESERRDALLGMTEAVDEYVKITVGAKLVKWAVDRYSEEKQQPLLKRASGLFAGLTGGRFAKLSVNFDAEPPELLAHRADGTGPLVIKGLSTGTEDQLYLALRLAALDLHLDAGTPLPLILDDIFINWSDERTAAGFRVLAELSKRTQVIVLSHHEHLIEVAKSATNEGVNIISLAA